MLQVHSMLKYIFIAFILAACTSPNDPTSSSKEDRIPVSVVHPCAQEITHYIETIGRLDPAASVTILPEGSGMITSILVREGQQVSKNEPLFSLDDAVQKLACQETEALLSSEKAALHLLERKQARYESLAQKELISKNEWEELETHIEQTKNTIDKETANLQKVALELDRRTVRAPFDGTIGTIPVCVGTYAQNGITHLTTLSQLDTLVASCSVTESEFFQIPKHDSHNFELATFADPTSWHPGKITFFDSLFEHSRGLLLIKGHIPNTDRRLLPGQVIRVRIPTKTEAALLLPQKAIQYNQTGPFVYIVSPEMTATVCQVVLGEAYETSRIILQGLKEGDTVVMDGQMRLSEGCKVAV